MKIIALAINALLAMIGALGSAYPKKLLFLARKFEHRIVILVAAAMRLLLGASLWSSAARSRLPWLLRSFGVFSSATGIAFPIVGAKRSGRILKWWYARSPAYIRGWALSIFAFGILMIWALVHTVREKEVEEKAAS